MSVDTIVLGIDDSAGSAAAAEWTAGLARRLGARVVAVHAYQPLDHLHEVQPGVDFAELRSKLEDEAAQRWCASLAEAGVAFETSIEEGRPADVLIAVSRRIDADLIVVGARRMGRVRTLALGSTSQKVIFEARRPVTLIHPPAD